MSAEPRLPSVAPSGPAPVLPSDRGPGAAGAPADVELPSARTSGNGGPPPPTTADPTAAGPAAATAAPPPPAAGPAAAGTSAAGTSAAGTLAERLRLATAQGPLGGAVPARYEAEDWRTVQSANPFEVLYLDYRQPGAVSQAVLEDRRDVLGAFWAGKKRLRDQGAGAARDRIEGLYGRDVGRFPGLVAQAYRRLADPEDRRREADALDAARRHAGEQQIAELVDALLDDGTLTPREVTRILRNGERAGLTADETAHYLLGRLEAGGFAPRAAPRGGAGGGSALVLSSEWVSADRRAQEAAEAASAAARARADAERLREEARLTAEQSVDPRVPPIEFDRGAAHSLAELVDMCDRYPAEARRYLTIGAVEQWLGRAGKAGAVVEAADRRRANPRDPARALELFVRDLCRRIGRPDVPVLLPRPSALVLGAMPQGVRQAARVEFAREGRPFVWGTARLAHELPGVRVSPTFADEDGRPGTVAVDVDTTHLAPGDYATHVLAEPEGGAAVAVPLRFSVQPLTLTVDRPALDLGAVPFGGTRSGAVRLATAPAGGRLVGAVVLANPRPGVTLVGGVGEGGGSAQVTVDARQTGPGVQYRSEIIFETNAGALRVPVTFRVRRASAEAAAWAAGLAVAGGAGMWAAREALVPGAAWHLSYGWASHAISAIIAGLTVGVVARVAGALVGRARDPGPPARVRIVPLVMLAGLAWALAGLRPFRASLLVFTDSLAHAAQWIGVADPRAAWVVLGVLAGAFVGVLVGLWRAGRPLSGPAAWRLAALAVVGLLVAGSYGPPPAAAAERATVDEPRPRQTSAPRPRSAIRPRRSSPPVAPAAENASPNATTSAGGEVELPAAPAPAASAPAEPEAASPASEDRAAADDVRASLATARAAAGVGDYAAALRALTDADEGVTLAGGRHGDRPWVAALRREAARVRRDVRSACQDAAALAAGRGVAPPLCD